MIVYEENHVKYKHCVKVNSCNLSLKGFHGVSFMMQYSQDSDMDSDEDLYTTQNSFVSREITESDVLSEQGSDIQGPAFRL